MSEWVKINAGEGGKFHNFEEEKELVGVLTGKQSGVGQYDSYLYTLENEDNEVINVWGSTALDRQMLEIPEGAEVKIVYMGKQTNPNTGRKYKHYEVYRKA